jgi:hypothetical protein
MRLRLPPRKRLLLCLAGLALAASMVIGRERPADSALAEGALAEPAARIDSRVRAEETELDLSRLSRERSETAAARTADPFARRSFAAEPQQAGGQTPHSAPRSSPNGPPQLPFTYLGKMIEDGQLAVFLGRGERSYSVRSGGKLDDEYRVDKVSEKSVTFTYLPTKTRQTLEIPAVNQ